MVDWIHLYEYISTSLIFIFFPLFILLLLRLFDIYHININNINFQQINTTLQP